MVPFSSKSNLPSSVSANQGQIVLGFVKDSFEIGSTNCKPTIVLYLSLVFYFAQFWC